MPWEPDRVGPSLMLYLTRWDEVDRLNIALHSDDPPWKLDPSDREKALAVIETANAQAETLLRRAIERGVTPALEPTIAFIPPHKLQSKIRKEWWTGYGGVRRRGPGRPRPAGWIELELCESPDLLVHFSFEGAERNKEVQDAMRKLARRATTASTDYVVYEEDGPAITGRIPLTEDKLFTGVVADVGSWVTQVVVQNWSRIESAVRNA